MPAGGQENCLGSIGRCNTPHYSGVATMVSEQRKRPPGRTFTDDEKAAFFAAFERLGSLLISAPQVSQFEIANNI